MELNDQFNIIYYDFLQKKAENREYILTIWITNKNGKYILTNNDLPNYRASNFYFSCVVKLKDCLLDSYILSYGALDKCLLIFEIKNIICKNNDLKNILNECKDISIMVDITDMYYCSNGIDLFNYCEFTEKNIEIFNSKIIIKKKNFNFYETDFIDGEYFVHFFKYNDNNIHIQEYNNNNCINIYENISNTEIDDMVEMFSRFMTNS
jgi:hypothetical protein